MAKGTGSRDGPGRCLRLLATHQQPCGISRHYSDGELLKTGIRARKGQFEGEGQELTAKSPTGSFGPIALLHLETASPRCRMYVSLKGSKPSSDGFSQECWALVRYPSSIGNLVSGVGH